MRLKHLLPLLFFLSLPIFAQSNDCAFAYGPFTGNSTQTGVANITNPCVNWRLTLSTTGTLSTTVTFQTSPDNSSWTSVGNSVCSSSQQPPCIIQGANPITGTQGMMYVSAYGAYVRVVVSASSGTGTGTVKFYGAKGASASAGNFGAGGGGGPVIPSTTNLLAGDGSGGVSDSSIATGNVVQASATLASTAIVTGAGSKSTQTPNSSTTIDASGNVSTPGSLATGVGSGTGGSIVLSGATSGTNTIAPAAVAGTGSTVTLPSGASTTVIADAGSANSFLTGITTAGAISKAQPTDANLSLSNIVTNNVSTSKHGFAPTLPNDATKYLDGTGSYTVPAGSGGGGAAGATLFSTTASTTVTAASATTLIGTVTGSTTVPANTFTAGSVLEILGQGYYTSTGARTLTINLQIGGSTRITTGAVTAPAATLGTWLLRCAVTTRTASASGTQIANCIFQVTGATLVAPGDAPMQTSSTWTVDTTGTLALDLTAAWDATTGAPTITATNVAAWIPGAPVTSVFGQTGAVTLAATSPDISTPSNPAAGNTRWYTKSGTLCALNPSGSETCTGSGGGAVSSVGGLTGAVPGGLILLEQHTASSSATVDFTTCISASYDEYQIEILGLIPAGAQDLWMRVSTNGGSTYSTTTYGWTYTYSPLTGGSGLSQGSSSDHWLIFGSTLDTASTGGGNATLKLFNPGSSALYKRAFSQAWFPISGNEVQLSGGLIWQTTTAINAFRFLAASGNISSGIIRCYGVAKQ